MSDIILLRMVNLLACAVTFDGKHRQPPMPIARNTSSCFHHNSLRFERYRQANWSKWLKGKTFGCYTQERKQFWLPWRKRMGSARVERKMRWLNLYPHRQLKRRRLCNRLSSGMSGICNCEWVLVFRQVTIHATTVTIFFLPWRYQCLTIWVMAMTNVRDWIVNCTNIDYKRCKVVLLSYTSTCIA